MIILVNGPRPARLRRALDEWHEASDQWVEKTIALAIELKEARETNTALMTPPLVNGLSIIIAMSVSAEVDAER